jgi:hypothetical protein
VVGCSRRASAAGAASADGTTSAVVVAAQAERMIEVDKGRSALSIMMLDP